MKTILISFSNNADHQNTVYSMFDALYPTSEIYAMGISMPKIPFEQNSNIWLVNCPPRPGICVETFYIWNLVKILYRVKKAHFDIIYFESLHIWNIPIMLFNRNQAKIFHVIHDVIPHEGDSQRKYVLILTKLVCKLSNVVILRNKKYIPTALNLYKMPPSKVKYLDIWRKFPVFHPSNHSKKVLFFGRLNPYKGLNNLLRIISLCPNIQFEIIGKSDPSVNEIVQKLALRKNVSINNKYVSEDEMASAFIQADWIITPYQSATQSGVVIDAYRFSRPVISFDVGAISEQIKDRTSGFLVEKDNVIEFARVLQFAVNMSRENHELFCRNAYIYGFQRYSSKSAAKKFTDVILNGKQ